MALMDRIEINDFLSMEFEERKKFILSIQDLRSSAIAQSKIRPIKTKAAGKQTKPKIQRCCGICSQTTK